MEIRYYRQPGVPDSMPPLAVAAGDFVFFAGGIAAHPWKGIPDEVKPMPGMPFHGSSIERQLRYIYNTMTENLDAAGSSIKRTMKINSYHALAEEVDMALRLRKDYFGIETPPPSTLMIIPETAVRGASVTIDVIALASNAKLEREALHKETEKTFLPPHDRIYGHPIYTMGVRGGGFIFTAGKTATPKADALEQIFGHPGFPYRDIHSKVQAQFILEFLKSFLEGAGASMEDVVKADLHMSNMKDIAGMEEVWKRFFPNNPPARVIHPTGFPGTNRIIEIEFIAVDPKGPYRKETIRSPEVPSAIGHEPQAVKAGPYLFLSGQLATDYKHGVAPEAQADLNFPFHSSSVKRQVRYILKNVEAVCRAAGTSAKNLLRRRAMHVDLNELSEAEEVWRDELGDRLPPTTTFRTSGPLPVPGCTVGYELIGYVPGGF